MQPNRFFELPVKGIALFEALRQALGWEESLPPRPEHQFHDGDGTLVVGDQWVADVIDKAVKIAYPDPSDTSNEVVIPEFVADHCGGKARWLRDYCLRFSVDYAGVTVDVYSYPRCHMDDRVLSGQWCYTILKSSGDRVC